MAKTKALTEIVKSDRAKLLKEEVVRVIYKYPVKPVMMIPKGAELCHFGAQNGELCAWFLVNPHAGEVEGRFNVFGTGQGIPEGAVYLKTCFDGPFVWHLFGMPSEEAE